MSAYSSMSLLSTGGFGFQMTQASRETLTRNIAANLKAELARMADGKSWAGAQERVDLLGVAQTAFAIEAAEPAEGKEAQALRAAAIRFERLLRRKSDRAIRENPLMPTKDPRALRRGAGGRAPLYACARRRGAHSARDPRRLR